MAETVSVEVTSNVTEFPYEKRFPSTMTLLDVKKKLELVVGALAESMTVELRDAEGKFVASLTDNAKAIGAQGVRDGMRLHVVDSSGANEELKDSSMVEKYEISDAAYEKRTDSVRNWKKEQLAKKAEAEGGVQMRDVEEEAKAAAGLPIGARCEVRAQGAPIRRGKVAFVGETSFADGLWVGVHYDEPVGKNDGSVKGTRYFTCEDKFGGFVRPSSVAAGDFAPLPIDDEDEMDEI